MDGLPRPHGPATGPPDPTQRAKGSQRASDRGHSRLRGPGSLGCQGEGYCGSDHPADVGGERHAADQDDREEGDDRQRVNRASSGAGKRRASMGDLADVGLVVSPESRIRAKHTPGIFRCEQRTRLFFRINFWDWRSGPVMFDPGSTRPGTPQLTTSIVRSGRSRCSTANSSSPGTEPTRPKAVFTHRVRPSRVRTPCVSAASRVP